MEKTLVTGLIIGGLNIILGLSVYRYKLDWMISGYNTLPKDEKKNVQIDKIRIIFRNFFTFTGLILIINVLLSYLTDFKFVHPIVIIMIITSFLIVNYLIGKYDNNKKGGMITVYRLFHKR